MRLGQCETDQNFITSLIDCKCSFSHQFLSLSII